MAKELAMVENNDRGREVRQYLIKIEQAWNTPELIFARALQMANNTIDAFKHRALEAERKNAVLMHVRKTYTAGEVAKELGFRSALDNTMGSGSTGIACINTNRNFIGIEKDDTYFKVAKERISTQNT